MNRIRARKIGAGGWRLNVSDVLVYFDVKTLLVCHWPCFKRTPSLYHSTTMSGSPTGTRRHSKCAGSFSSNLVCGFIWVLNLGGRGLSFWNMSSGGNSPALAYEGAIGTDGGLAGGSLEQNTSRPTWKKLAGLFSANLSKTVRHRHI